MNNNGKKFSGSLFQKRTALEQIAISRDRLIA